MFETDTYELRALMDTRVMLLTGVSEMYLPIGFHEKDNPRNTENTEMFQQVDLFHINC
jgi:hypothetical protein